jgi:transposase
MSNYESKVDLKNISINTENILTPFQRKLLETKLQEDLPSSYRQRIQIMLLASEGKSQAEICRTLKCCAATVRHWMHIARNGMAHQWQDCPIGRPKAVTQEYLERLRELVNNSPRDYGYSFERWTGSWLSKHMAKEFGVEVTGHHINRLLKQMGLSTRSQTSNKDNDNGNANSNRILITDLKSENTADSREFLSINSNLLGKDLDIYGSKSVRADAYINPVQQCNRIFSFRRGIPRLSQAM